MLIFVIEINTKDMKTLKQVTIETIGFKNLDSKDRYAKQRIVMTIAAKLKRIHRFDCKEMTITLKDIWNAFKSYLKSLTNEHIKATVATQPDLTEYYSNKPSNYNFGD